ncbi:uncharacterized protein LOC110989167 [Acanthaster planci]|uniref:Uncharacterized protein LOC110989167 n=1 Tax=Acanthaster planci TaxID=133434 RepID=A0A8B7ZZL6_ACAPL|nr:uncharacterized protein LOC110989167 [Acanthaster planci]
MSVSGNPQESFVTLSVRVADGGVLSIAEQRQESATQIGRVKSCEVQPLDIRGSHQANQRASRGLGSSCRRRPTKVSEEMTPSGAGHQAYRTVHFVLGVASVLKASQHADGSSQVELRPLALAADPRLPPLYGCIDGRGELQLSMGDYNQNVLGRMASLVSAMGLEEKPCEISQSPAKKVVVLNGKTWPTFPVAVTILNGEVRTHRPSFLESQLTAPVAPTSVRLKAQSSGLGPCAPHRSKPPVQMLPLNHNPVIIKPITPTMGVLTTREPKPAHARVASTSRNRCVPATSRTAVLVAENENNSASVGQVSNALNENCTGIPELKRADHYGSMESVCSIDTPRGRLYIAEQEDNPPPLSPQVHGHRGPDIDGMAGPISTQALPKSLCECHLETAKRKSGEFDGAKSDSCQESRKADLLQDAAFLNDAPVLDDTSETAAAPDGLDTQGDATSSLDTEPDAQAEGVASFLSYLQEMNKLMESALAGAPVETSTDQK